MRLLSIFALLPLAESTTIAMLYSDCFFEAPRQFIETSNQCTGVLDRLNKHVGSIRVYQGITCQLFDNPTCSGKALTRVNPPGTWDLFNQHSGLGYKVSAVECGPHETAEDSEPPVLVQYDL
ncbi:hypothetical protein IFM5058_10828 [Aspergillus udagawae]|nr:hypothetical protein IFM5058_10828 [Aspergillus udagawae]